MSKEIYGHRITFCTNAEQSEALDLLAAKSMTNVSSVMRQIVALYLEHAAPRPRVNGEHRESVHGL